MEFKNLSIRRIVTIRLGEKLGPNEDPGPLDFSDSKTQDTLENLYKERFGKPSLNELEKGVAAGSVTPRMPERRQEIKDKKTGVFSKMADSLKLYKIIPGGKSSEQAALWAGELYVRLVESEKVEDKAFLQLAGDRARSITGELEGPAQIPNRFPVMSIHPSNSLWMPFSTWLRKGHQKQEMRCLPLPIFAA